MCLPRDLREWTTTGALIGWLEEEVERLDHGSAPESGRTAQDAAKTLIRLLAFAYAIQVFESREIVRHCRSDVAFRLLCDDSPPFPDELVSFRRRNRSLIAEVLAQTFLRTLKPRLGLHAAATDEELHQQARDCALERLDIARHLDANDCGDE